MSATNRGTVRAAFDNYPTPAWCTRRLLEAWQPFGSLALPRSAVRAPRTVLEPCAGEGAIVRVVREMWPSALIGTYDIRPESRDALTQIDPDILIGIGDALSSNCTWGPGLDIVITNPPFRHADAFVEKALAAASHVAMLLPFQRLGDGHSEFFKRVGLPYLYILPERPSFVATTRCKTCGWTAHHAPQDPQRYKRCPECAIAGRNNDGIGSVTRGTQDVNCYAWFTWGPHETRLTAIGGYEYLPSTPLAERKAA